MSFSSKGKKYPIGSWLFGLHFLLLGIIQAYFQETNLENSFAWLAGNISILLFGTILGFVFLKLISIVIMSLIRKVYFILFLKKSNCRFEKKFSLF